MILSTLSATHTHSVTRIYLEDSGFQDELRSERGLVYTKKVSILVCDHLAMDLYLEAQHYVDFYIADKTVSIPYFINGEGRTNLGTLDGKGNVKQIREELQMIATQQGVDLKEIDSDAITGYMKQRGVGIDCSGYVYHLLDMYVWEKTGKLLSDYIVRYPGVLGVVERLILSTNRVRRINADTLTSDLNTVKIDAVEDIRVGDMIRLTPPEYSGKHIAIVVTVTDDEIVYTHSSECTMEQGPHFASIRIVDRKRGLADQEWNELLEDGRNYGKSCFLLQRGDSVRRLNCLV